MPSHDTVLILDFGSQYTQVIARRIRDLQVFSLVQPFDYPLERIHELNPKGIILSGGPQSVYGEKAPLAARGLFDFGIPILGICYGMQLTAFYLGGEVQPASEREYGRASLRVQQATGIFAGLAAEEIVWMSHGDRIAKAPPGFTVTATSDNCPIAAFADPERRIFGIQFHPEVSHTAHGAQVLRNFLFDVCGANADWTMAEFRRRAVEKIRRQVGDGRVICGLSGGVDSAVTALLVREAVGEQLACIFVDNGVLRKNEAEWVLDSFSQRLPVVLVDARERFLGALAGVTDPEQKRKIIGREFIAVFEDAAQKIEGVRFLAQGTLYPDVIESVSIKGPSAVIKTHHNVGGLPERMGLALVEPVRELFKDEVRRLGTEVGLPPELVGRHPFPGPGLAVRILGEVTAERVAKLQEADAIAIEAIRAAGLYDRIAQALVVLLPVKSVGVMGDARTYADVAALRCVDTHDFMTADWTRLPHDLLDTISRRIVNEVKGISRVVYDISSKPPSTIEWE